MKVAMKSKCVTCGMEHTGAAVELEGKLSAMSIQVMPAEPYKSRMCQVKGCQHAGYCGGTRCLKHVEGI